LSFPVRLNTGVESVPQDGQTQSNQPDTISDNEGGVALASRPVTDSHPTPRIGRYAFQNPNVFMKKTQLFNVHRKLPRLAASSGLFIRQRDSQARKASTDREAVAIHFSRQTTKKEKRGRESLSR
jgi:hypothetical protein